MKKIITFLFTLVMLCSVCFAAVPRASEYINSGSAVVKATATKGELEISYTVGGCGKMTEIGAYKIVVQEKNDGAWKPVEIIWGSVDNGMLDENKYAHTGAVTYTGTSGKQYRAIVTVYAANSAGSDTLVTTTSAATAK